MACSARVGISTGIILIDPSMCEHLAGNAWTGNPICKRAGGSTTCSVEALNVNLLATCGCCSLAVINGESMVVLMCDHWPLDLAVNGHWYGALEVRRLQGHWGPQNHHASGNSQQCNCNWHPSQY